MGARIPRYCHRSRAGLAALAAAAVDAEIVEVRDREPNGIACGVEAEVAIGERRARVTMSWHYADSAAAPRLATAYPSP